MNIKYDFATTAEYTKQNILEVQAKLLEMAKIVTEIFEKNNIKYMLAFGSLIGAVRHKGFIPWDDDLDFFILENDYDYAIECLKGKLPEWIIIQNSETDSTYSPNWTKLRDKNTETFSELFLADNLFTYKGICLDLYKGFTCPKKDYESMIFAENIDYYKRKKRIPNAMTEEEYQEKMHMLEPLYKDALLKAQNSNENEEVFAFTSIYKQKYYNLDWVFPLKKYKFEDTEFCGPNNADIILTKTYGDYNNVPPYEKRKAHYKYVKKI